jgi:hypothetical protein
MRRMKDEVGMMKCIIALLMVCMGPFAHAIERQMEVLIVRGADGEEVYGKKFDAQVKAWQEACSKGQVKAAVITRLDDLKSRVASVKSSLWIVMIGHGTFDGREAKFNLSGPDLSVAQLAEWLKPLPQEVVVVNTASASGAWVKPLSGSKRVIVSATKSAEEVFYTRFGEFMAKAIVGLPEADADQDRQVSLVEAFLYAAKQAAQFYETEERIATEHAIIEDNGDGVGTRSEVFEGVRPKDPKFDGARSLQLALVLNDDEMKLSDEVRTKRDALEAKVREQVARKSSIKEDEYYRELERLFREIAALGAK